MVKRLSKVQKEKILAEAAKRKFPISSICKKYQISRTSFYKWLKAGELKIEKKYQKTPQDRSTLILKVIRDGQKVAKVCRQHGVSRQTFYKWLRIWRKGERLEDRLRVWGRFYRQATPTQEKQVLDLIFAHPELSSHKISSSLPIGANGKPILGNHGVQNILKRYNLSTYETRLRWARGQRRLIFTPRNLSVWLGPPLETLRFLIAPFATIPKLVAAGIEWAAGISRPIFGVPVIGTVLGGTIFGIYEYFILLSTAPSQTRAGLIFATLALFFGLVFFMYSVKYYISILLVLTIPSTSEGKKKPPPGLIQDLGNIKLETQPFVSIHIPLYNEKNVCQRILKSTVNLDYPKDKFEVIVADDSTDETTEIVKKFETDRILESSRTGLEHPRVRVIHRDTRAGFKGGALEEARKITDSRAEYIIIFDADFIPFPDTIQQFLKYFKIAGIHNSQRIAAVQGYQWHVLNKSENWITRGVRCEYAGSYVVERSATEIYQGLKMIAGSVYCIRRDILDQFGWGTSITEDFQLTLKLYQQGYKVIYTPYIQAPSECVSTIRRLVRQRMRWAEGHTYNIKKYLLPILFGNGDSRSNLDNNQKIQDLRFRNYESGSHKSYLINHKSFLTLREKLELFYLAPYYLQAAFFMIGTISWFASEAVFHTRLPFWTATFGWSLVFTNFLALPLINTLGLFLEEAEKKDYFGIASFIILAYIVTPFQAYAAVKGLLEKQEGPWFRTPKTGIITDVVGKLRLSLWWRKLFPFGKPAPATAEVRSTNYELRSFSHTSKFMIHDSRRRLPFLSRSILAILLIITLLSGYLSVFVPPVSASPGLLFANATYSGNGTSQSISGLGFQPEVVIIKGGANNAVWTSSTMGANSTAYFTLDTANFAGGITSLDSDGFSVGSSATVNASATTYHYIAMADSDNSEMQVGSYAGNATDDRNITVGFAPEMVFLKGAGAQLATWKPNSLTGDNSFQFWNTSSLGANYIQNLTGASNDGFQVGTTADVNASGTTYHWVAFKSVAGKFSTGSYIGNDADNRNITDPGYDLQMVWVKGQDKTADSEVIRAIFRTDAHSGDTTDQFADIGSASNLIQGFVTNGFQVGTDNLVNDGPDGAGSITYHWVAWSTSLVPEFIGFLIPVAPFLPRLVRKAKEKLKGRRKGKRLWKPPDG